MICKHCEKNYDNLMLYGICVECATDTAIFLEYQDETVKSKFDELASRLEPENLHCDGEISNAEADERYRQIMIEWHDLEKQIGRKVSEDDIYNWWKLRLTKKDETEQEEGKLYTVTVDKVGLGDLKKQRKWLYSQDTEESEGLINLLDYMIDKIELA